MFYYVPRPLIDRTSLTMYTMHTHVSDTRIYTVIYIIIVRTRGKAIIEMALWAIKIVLWFQSVHEMKQVELQSDRHGRKLRASAQCCSSNCTCI